MQVINIGAPSKKGGGGGNFFGVEGRNVSLRVREDLMP